MGTHMYECVHGTPISIETRTENEIERREEYQCMDCFAEAIVEELKKLRKNRPPAVRRVEDFCKQYLAASKKERLHAEEA